MSNDNDLTTNLTNVYDSLDSLRQLKPPGVLVADLFTEQQLDLLSKIVCFQVDMVSAKYFSKLEDEWIDNNQCDDQDVE